MLLIKMINIKVLELVLKEDLVLGVLVALRRLLKLCLVAQVLKEDFNLILVEKILARLKQVHEEEVALDLKDLVVQEDNNNNRIMKKMTMVDKDKETNQRKLI